LANATKKTGKRSKSPAIKKVDKGIYQRGPLSFQVKIVVHGVEYTKTFDTLLEAQIWRDRKRMGRIHDPDEREIEKASIRKREARIFTLEAALKRYQTEVTPAKKGADIEKARINKILRYPIASMSMYSVAPEDIEDFLDELADEGLSSSSLARYYSLLSVIWKTAIKKWRKDIPNPFDRLQPPDNSKPRKRRLEQGEEEALISALREGNPEFLALVELAIETAARQGELLKLTWGDVSLTREDGEVTHGVAILRDTKNGETRAAPLSREACQSLLRIKPSQDPDPKDKVFKCTKTQLRSAWEAARKAAGCPDLRFHDLRHEAVSRLFELGLDAVTVSQISGHKTMSVLKDYAHLRPSNIAQQLNELKLLRASKSSDKEKD
jgi:integrase